MSKYQTQINKQPQADRILVRVSTTDRPGSARSNDYAPRRTPNPARCHHLDSSQLDLHLVCEVTVSHRGLSNPVPG